MKKVSSTNTKAEILEVYEQILEELKSERESNTSLKRELEKKQSIVQNVVKETKPGAVQNIHELRKILNDQLDKIESEISEEKKKFESLQEAIKIEKESLENLYKIKMEAESLEALILTKKKANEQLEFNFNQRNEFLEAEIAKKKLAWNQEEEAFIYELKIKRRNEEDVYNRKRESLEENMQIAKKELEEREKNIKEKETEFNNLLKQVEGFQKQLDDSIDKARKETANQLTNEFNYKQKLENKDLEATINLQKHEIDSLNKKIADQQEIIKNLSMQFENASKQSKEIALKAIESTGIKNLNFSGYSNKEEQK